MLTKANFFFIAFTIILSSNTTIFGMVLYNAPKEIPEVNMLSIFQAFFVGKNKTTIKKELEESLNNLREKDKNGESITNEDSLLIKNLWGQLKLLYNYSWLDRITNPFQDIINHAELIKIRNKKPFNTLLHSDKYSLQNKKSMDELFAYLGDTSRPSKPLDAITPLICEFAIEHSAVMSICLANKAFPNLFRNRAFEKKLSSFDKQIDSYTTEINSYKSVIERKQQVVQHRFKQCRDMINMHFIKNKPSKNN